MIQISEKVGEKKQTWMRRIIESKIAMLSFGPKGKDCFDPLREDLMKIAVHNYEKGKEDQGIFIDNQEQIDKRIEDDFYKNKIRFYSSSGDKTKQEIVEYVFYGVAFCCYQGGRLDREYPVVR